MSCESALLNEPWRASFGTNPTNHEWNGRRPWLSRVPNSAVPDLPATLIGRSTRLYVWRRVTVLRAALRITLRTLGESFTCGGSSV